MISFFKRRASSKEEHRLILRRKDSNCRGSVRMVIVVSVLVGTGAFATRDCGSGIWASNTFRTLEMSRLQCLISNECTVKVNVLPTVV